MIDDAKRGLAPWVVIAAALLSGCSHTPPPCIGRIEVIGDVEKPGFYNVYQGQKAAAVVKQVGDVDKENARFVFLYHATGKEPYAVMPLKNFLDHARALTLQADDLVVFSRVGKPQVFVSAQANAAGAQPWVPGMTVSDALNGADLDRVHALRTGIRISRYGEKGSGSVGRRVDGLFPGDSVLVHDLYQANVPKKDWIERAPRTKALIVGPGEEMKGAEER